MSDLVSRLNTALAGRYRVERLLGEGGMATVYLADDLRHERKVALKVLRPELAAVVGAERFLAEIKTTAKLQHPHILPLFDSGESDDLVYYVMPYVEGETLRDRLEREHQLPVDEAVRIATSVADALEYAHARGVIHRDIKPANILLQDGRPVVSDFGIALAVGAGGARLTETGLSLGTPYYMSPEQATGDVGVGPASDIYSLGCVLYEMLAGEPPYTGATPQAILGKIIAGEPTRVTKQRTSVPPNVDAVIARALEKVPADRFTGAQRVADALADKSFRHGTPVAEEATATGTTRGRGLTVALAVLAAVSTIVAGWALLRPEPAPPVARFGMPLPEDLTIRANVGVGVAVAPDGSEVVFAGTTDGRTELWRRTMDRLEAVPIPGTEGARSPTYAPDGRAIAFLSSGRLMTVSLTGAPPLTLLEEGVANGRSGLAWGRDGWLYYRPAGLASLWRVSEDGGQPEEAVAASSQAVYPDVLPNGRGVLFTSDFGSGESEIAVLDTSAGTVRSLLRGAMARFATSGHIVYTSNTGTLLAVPFDQDRLELTGPPRTLLEGVEMNAGLASQFALSANGTLVYMRGGVAPGFSLAVVDTAGNRRMLPLPPRNYTNWGPSWAPDGRSIVFSSGAQIFIYDTVLNTTPRQLTFDGVNLAPVVSPDGSRVVFSREGPDGVDLYVRHLSDDEPPGRLIQLDGTQVSTQWPSDDLLLFETLDGLQSTGLWILDLSDPDDPKARPYLTSVELRSVVISPDGTLAAFRSLGPASEDLYIRSFPEPGERTIVSGAVGGGVPFWSPDGRTLYYGTALDRLFLAARVRADPVPMVLATDTLFQLLGLGAVPFPQTTLHPDGDRFILVVPPDPTASENDTSGGGRVIVVQNFLAELATAS